MISPASPNHRLPADQIQPGDVILTTIPGLSPDLFVDHYVVSVTRDRHLVIAWCESPNSDQGTPPYSLVFDAEEWVPWKDLGWAHNG
jgi:hypothetical protein